MHRHYFYFFTLLRLRVIWPDSWPPPFRIYLDLSRKRCAGFQDLLFIVATKRQTASWFSTPPLDGFERPE